MRSPRFCSWRHDYRPWAGRFGLSCQRCRSYPADQGTRRGPYRRSAHASAGRVQSIAMRRLHERSAHRHAVLRARDNTFVHGNTYWRVRAERCGLFGNSCIETSPSALQGAEGPASHLVRARSQHETRHTTATNRPWAGRLRLSLPTIRRKPVLKPQLAHGFAFGPDVRGYRSLHERSRVRIPPCIARSSAW
jgi:hypothetical protein